MKKIIYSLLILSFTSVVSAQVGINTDTPTTTLDVQGKPTVTTEMDGVRPPRITGAQLRAKTYTADQDGAIVYVIEPDTAPANQTEYVKNRGLYYFDSQKNRWMRFNFNYEPQSISPFKIDFSIASQPVQIPATTTTTTIRRQDIGIETSITIPPYTTMDIIVDYSTPAGQTGTKDFAKDVSGYYGVTFLRKVGSSDFVEAPMASRKFTTIPNGNIMPHGNYGFSMITVGAKYIETYTNSTNSPVTLRYKLQGYVEGTKYPTKFNMWTDDGTGENYNWGKGSMSLTAYIRL